MARGRRRCLLHRNPLNTRAEVLIGLGRYDQALEPAETSLRIREQVGNLEKTARSYHTLAYLYFKLGRHDDAARMFERAIEAKERVHGKTHPEFVATLERFAEFLTATKRADEAASARTRAKEIRKALRRRAS